MKLLIVFLSALVLVAHGKAAPSNDEERANQVQAELVAGDAALAGQEVDGVGPQDTFAEAAPAEEELRVVGDVPQRSLELEELRGEFNAYLPETVYIPFISRACTNSSCLYICNLLGFANGTCVSTTTCQCYN